MMSAPNVPDFADNVEPLPLFEVRRPSQASLPQNAEGAGRRRRPRPPRSPLARSEGETT